MMNGKHCYNAIAAIICAAGSSSRMGGIKKEYRFLKDVVKEGNPLSVLASCVQTFSSIKEISHIIITVPNDPLNGEEAARKIIPAYLLNNPSGQKVFFVTGGSSRQDSVYKALLFLETFHPDYVLIHDGARPWADSELINRVINGMIVHKAILPVMPLIETPKEIDDKGFIVRHLKRASIVSAQTPQGFSFPEILQAHKMAAHEQASNLNGKEYTDDAEIWAEFIGPVAAVTGSPLNKKITFPEDLSENEYRGTR
jgi:2-C-methyl-D-erythritol 4-phosphate cytidylyltransferase/2-C-methyl-D-erythritol 4-phosphate cytidylyltransferase/2-C-methyl-D-erythritol 2,4-cyclodiphosphate synthase